MAIYNSIQRQNAFAFSFSKAVAAEAIAKDSNLVLSPLSIHVALSFLSAGCGGQTLDQLVSFLGFDGGANSLPILSDLSSQIAELVLADGSAHGGPLVSFANGMFVAKTLMLKPSFSEIADNVYKSQVSQVNFEMMPDEAADEISAWIENATGGLIKDLIPHGSIDADTRLVLTNALYFNGSWTEKFDALHTRESEFHLLKGTSIQVPFMTTNKKQYVSSYDGFKVLRLPYNPGEDRRQFSMYIFLPDTRNGIGSLMEKICSEYENLSQYLPWEKVPVRNFKLPKFKISFGFEATETMQNLGLTLPFSHHLADLSGISGKKLYVKSIFHKSFIEVDEEGTKAAAATAIISELFSLSFATPIDFEADHPFIFLIREDTTGAILFVGQVLNPLT